MCKLQRNDSDCKIHRNKWGIHYSDQRRASKSLQRFTRFASRRHMAWILSWYLPNSELGTRNSKLNSFALSCFLTIYLGTTEQWTEKRKRCDERTLFLSAWVCYFVCAGCAYSVDSVHIRLYLRNVKHSLVNIYKNVSNVSTLIGAQASPIPPVPYLRRGPRRGPRKHPSLKKT